MIGGRGSSSYINWWQDQTIKTFQIFVSLACVFRVYFFASFEKGSIQERELEQRRISSFYANVFFKRLVFLLFQSILFHTIIVVVEVV
jgi:hypothetical protein